MNRKDALIGALVADAAAMGLHWMYDQEQVAAVAKTGDVLFRQPDAQTYKDKRGYFAHGVKRSGELSHYGESARVVGQLTVQNDYSTEQHRTDFFESFGPCGHYCGYADKPTKVLLAKMLVEEGDISEPSGMDDNQMPALCVVPGIFASSQGVDVAEMAAKVISINTDVVESVKAVYQCLEDINDGLSLSNALASAAESTEGPVGKLMQDALAADFNDMCETARGFGLACYIEHAIPVVWYILNNSTDFESAIRNNILCGGDSCGRSMALGAIAGLAFGVPEHLIERMENKRVPINF